jgi:hypothetical protein
LIPDQVKPKTNKLVFRRRTDNAGEPSTGSQKGKMADNIEEPLTGTKKGKMDHTCSTSEDVRYNLSDNCHNYAQVNIILNYSKWFTCIISHSCLYIVCQVPVHDSAIN